MAFTFVVETGDADPDSNSYTTVPYADDYVEANIHESAKWLDLEEEDKERLLVRSSKQLDARYKWHGRRVDRLSGLAWPRAGAYDGEGFQIPDDEIPRILQDAVVEFAVYLMNDDWTAPRTEDQFREIQVDTIDLKFNTDYSRAYVPPTIQAMLEDLGSANTGGRVGFKKIKRA